MTPPDEMKQMKQKIHEIPVVVNSGDKYINQQGVKAIKDGVRSPKNKANKPTLKKPSWLKIPLTFGGKFKQVKSLVKAHRLNTVCEEAKCPNINECWEAGTATIMILGSICTRACRFCSVDTGNPKGWLDLEEAENAAKTVKLMGLKYVVITSVDRDDLADGGAKQFADTVKAIKSLNPETKIEVLTPDFQGNTDAIDLLVDAGIDVFAQNIETVERLTKSVRDPKAGYKKTLDLLAYAKNQHPSTITKTSLMLGLGETDDEVLQCMRDIRLHYVDILTLGQYLRPTLHHLSVERYVSPSLFNDFRESGLKLGFLEVVSGPLVRSSYRAEKALEKNNVGLLKDE